jgi:uncharacterized protein YkwD
MIATSHILPTLGRGSYQLSATRRIAFGLALAIAVSLANADSPHVGSPKRVSERVLQLVNAARTHGRRCGYETFRAVAPVRLSGTLESAARDHVHDMAAHNFFEHTGSDGSSPTERLARTGYRWRLTGENIAYGPTSPEEVVRGWLASPGHCENIMEPRFTEMGVAYAVGSTRGNPVYWDQTFAVPRKSKL